MDARKTKGPTRPRTNRLVAACAAIGVVAMVGATYAAVPLYSMFCRATGFGGTTQVAVAAPTLRGERVVSVRFDANVAPGLPWSFEPEVQSISLRTGATATVYFKVFNRSSRESAATAVYNVSPGVMGGYFDKLACFCFTETRLGPRQSAELPVVFFLDPRLEKDETLRGIDEITLSYTLFASREPAEPVASAPAPASGKAPL